MSTEPVTRDLKIEALVRGPRYQIRKKLDSGQVSSLVNAYRQGAAVPPVLVAQVGTALILVDGYHRVKALLTLEEEHVRAVIVQAEEKEARWLSAKANLTHGVRLKHREVFSAFQAYIKARKFIDENGELKSYRTIAVEMGGVRGYTTIREWMKKYHPAIFKRMGGAEEWKGTGGLTYTEDPQRLFTGQALERLTQARAAFQGITEQDRRIEVISRMEELLQEMKDGKFDPLAPPEAESDF